MKERCFAFVILFCSLPAFTQQPNALDPDDLVEFPIVLLQNVAAGKTAVGTAVQAKLVVATLVKKVVVPKDAVFSGIVEESAAKTDQSSSRLVIRIDSVRWKSDQLALQLYITNWYYPLKHDTNDDDANGGSGLHGEVTLGMGGRPPYPGSPPRSIDDASGPYPDTAPPAPSSAISSHRVQMDGITASRDAKGQIAISSSRRTIKLDKATTYVLATSSLVPAK
jgi:hypothetical protein